MKPEVASLLISSATVLVAGLMLYGMLDLWGHGQLVLSLPVACVAFAFGCALFVSVYHGLSAFAAIRRNDDPKA